MKYYLQTPLKNLSFLFLFLFCTSSLVRAQNKYTLQPDDVIVSGGVITECICEFTNKDIIIPEKIDGQTITGIGDWTFYQNALTSLDLPASLTSIEGGAFWGNNLTSVTFPAGLASIGDYAFSKNALTSVDLPAGLTTIGDWAFARNTLTSLDLPAGLITIEGGAFYDNSLTSIDFPAGLTTIGDRAFLNSNLTSVTFPASLTTIGDNAFRNNALTSVTFSDGLTTTSNIQRIGAGAFSENSSLTGITLPAHSLKDEFNNYEDSGGKLYNPDDGDVFMEFSRNLWANINCHELTDGELTIENRVITACNYNFANKSICIPDMINGVTITGIADEVFQSEGLISVEFPASLETIGDSAFKYNDLASLDFPDNSRLTSIGHGAFKYNDLASLDFPASLTTIGYETFRSNALTSLDFPASLTSIGERAFYDNDLNTLDLSALSSLTSIGRFAFSDNALTSLDFPAILTTIGDGAFSRNALTSVTFPASLTTIGESAFSSNKIKSVVFPASLTSIGDYAFIYNDLTSLDFPASLTTIGESAFSGNEIESVTFPASLTTIGGAAFDNNELTSLDLSALSNLTSIGRGAFSSNKIKSVVFPASLTTIGERAFYGNALTSVTFPASLTTIGDRAFSSNKIKSVVFPASLTTIGDRAFSSNKIKSVVFPASLTTIGESAFYSNDLTEVTFPDVLTATSNIQSIGAWAFFGNSQELTGITLPAHSLKDKFNNYEDSGGSTYGVNDDFTEFSRNLWADITCHELTDGELTIENRVITECNYGFANKSICIPDEINGVTITGIDDWVFQSEGLISVEFPASLETIGDRAFRNNSLTTLDLSALSSLTSIGERAFYDNDLASLDFPASLKTIGNYAFSNNALTEVTFPASLTIIGDEAFSKNALNTLDLSALSSLTSIGNSVFSDNNLTSVDFPASLKTIGNYAFYDNALTSLDFPASLTSIGERAFSYNDLASLDLSALSSLTSIGNSVFSDNNLTSVDFPASLTSIGERAFYDNDLNTLDLSALSSLTSIGYSVFSDNNLTSVDFPASLTTIGESAFTNNNIESVAFPASLTSIGWRAFYDNALTLVTFSNKSSLTSIEDYAFSNNPEELTGITLPTNSNGGFEGYKDSDGHEYDPDDDFEEFSRSLEATIVCDKLTSEHLKVNEGVITEYTNDAANGCIIIPSTYIDNSGNQQDITGIGDYAFDDNDLTSVTFPASLASIGSSAFYGNLLAEVIFPDGLKTIGERAFFNNLLTSVVFPDNSSLTSIGKDAFSDNTSLTSIILPTHSNEGFEGYIEIAQDGTTNDELINEGSEFSTFSSRIYAVPYILTKEDVYVAENGIIKECNESLPNRIIIPETIDGKTILEIADRPYPEKGVFESKGLTSVKFLENSSLTSIGSSAFFSNHLAEVIFPDGLTTIGQFAFGFNELTKVKLPASLTSIGRWAFGFNELTEVTFPDVLTMTSNIQRIGAGAFYGNSSLEKIKLPTFPEDSDYNVYIATVRDDEENFSPGNDFPSAKFSWSLEAGWEEECYTLRPEENLRILDGVITEYTNDAANGCIVIPEKIDGETITGIGYGAFSNNALTSVTFPDGLKTIGERAFFDNALTSLDFPASLKTIGESAFRNNLLTQVTFEVEEKGSSIVSIGKDAFSDNTSLTSIILPTHSNIGFEGYIEIAQNGATDDVLIAKDSEFSTFSSRIYAVPYILTKEDVDVKNGIIKKCKNESLPNRIIIPETINGETITGIGRYSAFSYKKLTSVTFSKNSKVTTIGEWTFHDNALTTLNLPAGLTTIGDYAFHNNALTSVTFPTSLTTIEEVAFSNNALTEVTFPASLTTIGISAFYSNDLTKVTFVEPSSIEVIGSLAFQRNGHLQSTGITLPENINHTNITYDDGEEKYSHGDKFTNFERTLTANLTPYVFKSGDLEVENGVITKCKVDNLENKRIVIPEEWPNIQGELEDIIGIADKEYPEKGVFEDKGITSVTFSENSKLTSIGERAFENNNLRSVTFPNSLISIGGGAFWDNALISLDFPANLTTIGDWAFYRNKLETVSFPESSNIQSIGAGAFSWNSSLTGIKLPAFADSKHNVYIARDENNEQKYLPGQDFLRDEFYWSLEASFSWEECHTLTSEELTVNPEGVITACSYDFTNKCIVIPEQIDIDGKTITGIVDGSYYEVGVFERQDLTSVKFPASLTTIGDYAFYDNDLPSLDLSALSNLTTIGDYAFYDNAVLTSVTFPASLTTIGIGAFYLNVLLKLVKFDLDENDKSSIESIGHHAFNENNNLSSITLPDNNNENFQGYSDSYGNTYEVGDSFSDFYPSYSIVTSDPSSSRMAIYDASHSDVEILEQPQPFTYYPNPVVSQLTVTANVGDRILILNQVGVTVYDEVVTSVVAHQIDVTDFPRGVYLIRLISAEGSVITKRLAKH